MEPHKNQHTDQTPHDTHAAPYEQAMKMSAKTKDPQEKATLGVLMRDARILARMRDRFPDLAFAVEDEIDYEENWKDAPDMESEPTPNEIVCLDNQSEKNRKEDKLKKKRERDESPKNDSDSESRKKKIQALTIADENDPYRNEIDSELMEAAQETQISQNTIITHRKRNERVPPIMITMPVQYKKFKEKMEMELQHKNFDVKCYFDGKLKVQLKSVDDYRKIQNALIRDKVKFFTNVLKADLPFRYVIKGVPVTMTENEVVDELEGRGFTITRAIRLTYRKKENRNGKIPITMMLIELPKNEKNKEIFKINRLENLVVTIEKFRKRGGPTQCWNCQSFNHSSLTCHRDPVCVKCAGSHRSYECQRKHWGKDAKCGNCGGSHPANFSGCPKFPGQSQGKSKNAQDRAKKQERPKFIPSTSQGYHPQKKLEENRPSIPQLYSEIVKTRPTEIREETEANQNIMLIILEKINQLTNQVGSLNAEIIQLKARQNHGY